MALEVSAVAGETSADTFDGIAVVFERVMLVAMDAGKVMLDGKKGPPVMIGGETDGDVYAVPVRLAPTEEMPVAFTKTEEGAVPIEYEDPR